jgi:hypothetical protein
LSPLGMSSMHPGGRGEADWEGRGESQTAVVK